MSPQVLHLIISLCTVWQTHKPFSQLDQSCVAHMIAYNPQTKKEALREWRDYKNLPPVVAGR